MAFSKSNKSLKIIVGIMLICCILMLFWPKSGNLVLIGYDETGNRVRIRISANDGQTLTSRDRITVSYYEKSSRLIEFVGATPIQ